MGSLVAAALLLGAAAQAHAQDEQRLTMVEQLGAHPDAGGQGYDVGFIGEPTEAAVYLDSAQANLLRAQGFRIGEVVFDARGLRGRQAEIRGHEGAEARRPRSPRAASPSPRRARVRSTSRVMSSIQQAVHVSNYAGRFLYVEAHNKDHTDTTGPAMSFTYTGPNGTSQVYSLPTAASRPDGGDAAIGGNKIRDTDAGAGAQYMYHRGLVPLRGADADAAAEPRSPCASRTPTATFDTATPSGSGRARPCRRASPAFQKDFITKYMDPTEIYNRMDQLTASYRTSCRPINLPNKTARLPAAGEHGLEGTTVSRAPRPA